MSHETNPEMACDYFRRLSVKRNPGAPCCEAGIFTVCGQVSGLSDAGPWGKMGSRGRLDPAAGGDNGRLRNEALLGWASAVTTTTG